MSQRVGACEPVNKPRETTTIGSRLRCQQWRRRNRNKYLLVECVPVKTHAIFVTLQVKRPAVLFLSET